MTRPQFLACFALASAFGHWWTDAAAALVHGTRPDGDGYSQWASQVNASRANGSTARSAWERYSRDPEGFNAALLVADKDNTYPYGGVETPVPVEGIVKHSTGSHSLTWEVNAAGSVTLTARRRGSSQPHTYVLPDGSRHEGHAPGPHIWWTATVIGAQATITGTEAAPEPDSPGWERDEAAWCQSGGEYTWATIARAISALGAVAPALPPLKPRRFSPLRGGARRSMAAIA